MKNKFFIITAILLFLSVTAFCIKTPEEVKRVITKEFPISADGEVLVSNKYGNLTISEWTKDQVSFSIEIIGKGEKTSIAQEMSDRVSINFNKNGNKISAETTFKEKNFNCNNCGTTVNYTIKVPTDVYLNLTNKYGNITLNRTDRPFKCELKYGNLTANQLLGQSSTIWIKYGNADIDKANDITLDMGYGNLNIEEVHSMKFNSSYSRTKIGTINSLSLTSKYDKFNIESLGELRMTTGYTDFNIGELKQSFSASGFKYSKLRIDRIATDFQNIDIDAAYTTIRLGISSQLSFRADLQNRYGNIKTNGIIFQNTKLDNGTDRYTKSISGIVGSDPNPTAKISISDRYADIILEK